MYVLQPFPDIEAGAGLVDPREVAVTDNRGFGIVYTEVPEKVEHGGLLGFGAGVGRTALTVETALVADADAVGVVAAGMGTGLALGTTGIEHAVAGDVVVVAHRTETARLVARLQRLKREAAVGTCGRAMDDDKIYAAHCKVIQLCTAKVPAIAVRMVMIRLMMRFHLLYGGSDDDDNEITISEDIF